MRLSKAMAAARPGHGPSGLPRGIRLPLALLMAVLAGCTHIAAPWAKKAAADGDVTRRREEWNQIVAYRRMADLGALVADDVQVIAPARSVNGRRNLVRSFEALVHKRPDLVQIFTPERVERHPRWKFAAERGRWSESWQEQGEQTELRGSYYALWKLKDGRWRLHSQIITPLSCKGARYCKTQE